MEQKDNSLRQKISSWLSNRDNSEGDLVDFLVDECGIVLEEEDCCEFGDINNQESECCKCDKTMIPSEEHNKDSSDLYVRYYGSEEDDGDICYKCCVRLTEETLEESFKRIATEMTGGTAKISVNF